MKIIAGIGHRPSPKLGGYKLPNPIYNYVCKETEKMLLEEKPNKVITGMGLGFDSWLANICIKLKIPFIAAIPFPGQESKWPESSKKIYKILLSKADDVIMINDAPFSSAKLQKRNEWMIDQCDKLIAVYIKNSTEGVTYNCVQYAKKHEKDIIIIDPSSFTCQ